MSEKSNFKDDALAILKSIKSEYMDFPHGTDWNVRPLTRLMYWRIKAMAIEYLNIGKSDILQKLEEKLTDTFHFVDLGRKHFEIGSSDGDPNEEYIEIPPALCLDRVEWELLKDDTPKYFFENYLLLVLMDMVKFERAIDKLASRSNRDRQSNINDLFESSNILMDAEVALELGIASYERSRGKTFQKKYEFVNHTYASGIEAQKKRDKSNQDRQEKSRNKKRPLLWKIHQLHTIENMGVTKATYQVAGESGFTDRKAAETLRRAYYVFVKNPEDY